ncbi:hypothetical protein MHYP_G00302350 [Metynnis hypsauchen]
MMHRFILTFLISPKKGLQAEEPLRGGGGAGELLENPGVGSPQLEELQHLETLMAETGSSDRVIHPDHSTPGKTETHRRTAGTPTALALIDAGPPDRLHSARGELTPRTEAAITCGKSI